MGDLYVLLNMAKIIKSDDYEEMGSTFQVMMLTYLNMALESQGIQDKDLRKKVCEDFGFTFSVWKDQYWFRAEEGGRKFFLT